MLKRPPASSQLTDIAGDSLMKPADESMRIAPSNHSHAGMTARYSVAQGVEIREALEKITDEKHANNTSLASIIREARVPT